MGKEFVEPVIASLALCKINLPVYCCVGSVCGSVSLFCFQTINMSIQSHCYLKASRSRWFAQPGSILESYDLSWHSCSPGSAPTTMHLSLAAHLSHSEVWLSSFRLVHKVIPSENHKLLFSLDPLQTITD